MLLTQNRARTHKIGSIPGDGIGVEVIEQTIKVLRTIEALFNSFTFDINSWTGAQSGTWNKGNTFPQMAGKG